MGIPRGEVVPFGREAQWLIGKFPGLNRGKRPQGTTKVCRRCDKTLRLNLNSKIRPGNFEQETYKTMKTCKTIAALGISALLALPAIAQNPYQQANNTWISLSGTVTALTSPDTFTLNYGNGTITVEMDDWDTDADAYKLVADDKVTVNGWIDDDFFEMTKIEASSVYVENLGTYFYASGVDEEDTFVSVATPIVVSSTVIQGTVSEVGEEEFVVNTGLRKITVETEDMTYDPLDDEGFQKIQKGDRVSVAGKMDKDFFEGRELKATSVVTMKKGPNGSTSS